MNAGDVVVITGASRGIGRDVARAAAARGASVGLVARNADDLEALRSELSSLTTVAVAACDVGDAPGVAAAMGALTAELGPIDVLVANAGIGLYGPFIDADPADLERLVRVNLLGTMHAIRAVAPNMVARRRGHIVIVGSIAGRLGAPFEAAYSATKFGQSGLAECLAVELSPYDVGVSVVNPGPVDTGFFEARGTPYNRKRPQQVPTSAVVDAVLRAVDTGRGQQTVPRGLGAAVVIRHVLPWAYRVGTKLTFRKELADDARRR